MITIIIIIPQNNLIRHQVVIQNEEACVLTKEDMLSIFSNLAIMVLDVNFINPTETANFLFFDDREDAKKTDNNVVKGKGCLIHVHEDINNLPPFPSTFLQLSRPKRGFWARRKGTCWPPESEPA